MNPSELDKAVAYTKQFIEAATPIAKQAYEIGIMTLRIDAVQTIVFSLAFLVLAVLVAKRVRADYVAAKVKADLPANSGSVWRRNASDHMFGDGFFHVMAGVVALVAGVAAVLNLLSVWTWAKLFAPELWLARQAIEKIVN